MSNSYRKKSLKIKVKKRIFLKRVRNRLRDEVGLFFEMLAERRAKDDSTRATGFWTGVRLLMPVIDAVSSVMMRKGRKDLRPKAVRFMEKELSIKYPFIVWEMFRHALLHGDEMRGLSYRNKKVNWGVSIGLRSHLFKAGHCSIDVLKLYGDLMDYLESEIPNAKGYVYVEEHIKYKKNIKPALKKEIIKIQG